MINIIVIIIFSVLIIESILYITILKFFESDYFIEKTGIKIYDLIDEQKKYKDFWNVIFSIIPTYIFFSLGYMIYWFFNDVVFSLGFIICGLLIIYSSILVLIRLNYYPFIEDSENDNITNETIEKVNVKSYHIFGILYDNSNLFTYVDRLMRLIYILNIINVLFLSFFIVFDIQNSQYCFIIWFIAMHLAIFPDYIKKYLKIDIRKESGWMMYLISYAGLLIILGDIIFHNAFGV